METEYQEDIHKLAKLAPWLRALIVGAFIMGGWAATLEFRVQTHGEISRASQAELKQLSRVVATHYPLADGHSLDRRISRLETQNEAIRESLARIEKAIQR
jgi:hypothetical protein